MAIETWIKRIKQVVVLLIAVDLMMFVTINNSYDTKEESNEENNIEATTDEVDEKQKQESVVGNIKLIIDITDYVDSKDYYIGNTSSLKSYSGIAQVKLNEDCNTDIKIGKTYVMEAMPIIETADNGYPMYNITKCNEATDNDIAELEEIRGSVSNYKLQTIKYKTMSLDEIIEDGNKSYATWTQEEIGEYLKYIKKLGYTDNYKVKSYVNTRDALGGSILNN